MAARTAVEAVQAAAAPEPVAPSQPRASARPSEPVILPPQRSTNAQHSNATPHSTVTPRPTITSRPAVTPARAAQAASAARAGIMSPLKSASKALWHEVTGSFFALFAASFSIAVWHTRAHAASTVPNDRYRFYAFCALALLFAYFSVSSFLLARKRG